eukprot:60811-Chlamydomonas_euryale.AAC.4
MTRIINSLAAVAIRELSLQLSVERKGTQFQIGKVYAENRARPMCQLIHGTNNKDCSEPQERALGPKTRTLLFPPLEGPRTVWLLKLQHVNQVQLVFHARPAHKPAVDGVHGDRALAEPKRKVRAQRCTTQELTGLRYWIATTTRQQ